MDVEEAGAWTVVQPSGRGKNGDQVELGQDELNEELLVEVHNFQEPLAQGVVRASELLQVTLIDLLVHHRFSLPCLRDLWHLCVPS